jgi:methionyl-tRNA synthetase
MIFPQSQFFAPTQMVWALVAWSLFWKGLALWRAARNQHKYWFIALLVINTAGVLEILYLIFVDKVLMKNFWSSLTSVKEAAPEAKEAPKAEIKPVEKPVENPENKA